MSVDNNYEEVPASLKLEPNPFEQSFASRAHNQAAGQANPQQASQQPPKHDHSSVSSSFAAQPVAQAASAPGSSHSHATSRASSTQTSSYGPQSRNRSLNNLPSHSQAIAASNQLASSGLTPLPVSPGHTGVWMPSHIGGSGSMGQVAPQGMQRPANANLPAPASTNAAVHNGVPAVGIQPHLLTSPGMAMIPNAPLMPLNDMQQQAPQQQQLQQQLAHLPGLPATGSPAANVLNNPSSSVINSQAPSVAANGLYMLSQPNLDIKQSPEDDGKNTRRKRAKTDKQGDASDNSRPQSPGLLNNGSAGEDNKRQQFLERNRVAAVKCRQRKKQFVENLKSKADALQANNVVLNSAVMRLQSSVDILRDYILKNVDVRQAPHQVMAILNPSMSQQQHQQLQIPCQTQQQQSIMGHQGSMQAQNHQLASHISTQGQVPKNISTQLHGSMSGMPGMPPGVILPQNDQGRSKSARQG